MQLAISSPKVYMATHHVDFRRSIDGLLSIASEEFNPIPKDSIFIFYNRARDKLKVLGWHRNGHVLLYKRLERGRFTIAVNRDGYVALSAEQFSWLMAGLNWVDMSSWNDDLNFNYYH